MNRFAIFGPGGFGREIVSAARLQPRMEFERRDIVFVADLPSGPVLGIDVIPPDLLCPADELVIAIGDSAARRSIYDRLSHIPAGSLFSSSSLIGPECEIGEGAVFCNYTMVTACARIGRQFQCNIYSYVAHDCRIGDFVTFAPRVCCNGNVTIGDDVYVGTGAALKPGITIGDGSVIGMGAVVVKDVEPGTTVIGNPAKSR